jgi:HK97 family phage prohead protease
VALFNHDMNAPLARVSNGKLQLHDSPEALNATIRLNPKVQAHRDLFENCKDQLINACSFAFSANKGGENWTQEYDDGGIPYVLRSVSSAKLFDVSLLSAPPAYGEGATAVQARSLAYRYSVESEAVKRARMGGIFGPDGLIHLSLEERLLATAYDIRKDREAMEAAEREDEAKRWAEKLEREFQAWRKS